MHVRMWVSVCVYVAAESDLRGPASYSLSAGDHHFHKTSIVGTELQTPETHTGNDAYAHKHTKIHAHHRQNLSQFKAQQKSCTVLDE